MASARMILALGFAFTFVTPASAADMTPISKVLQLLSDLQAKIIKEGEEAQKEYASYAEWCEDKSKDLGYEIKTGEDQVFELQATITKESANIEALDDLIGTLTAQIAAAEANLKAATVIRGKEAAAFSAQEKELVEVISALERAIGILTSEMAKSGASFVQMKGSEGLIQALSTLVQASMLSSADAGKLTALVQQQSSDAAAASDADSDLNAPDAAIYEGHSANIIETLESLKEKADTQLADARKTETTNLYNFQLFKQSLEDEISNANGEMDQAKDNKAASAEAKGIAEGDLAVTSKDLAADKASLADLHQVCMATAQDFEAATKSRTDELNALAAAKKAVADMTGAADTITYGLAQVSLLQQASTSEQPQAVVRFMLELSRKQNSKSLAQLATRISSTIRMNSGEVPLEKVKGLIADLIDRLTAQGEADASHKAYCDKELHESTVKFNAKTAEIEKMTTRIDSMSSRKAVLEEEVGVLMKELADIAKSQAEYDAWFQDFEKAFKSDKADMEEGIAGVKIALKVLRDYYAKSDKAHVAAEGAGTGIIGLLEVVEADFTKGLAESEANYANQKAAYIETSKENEITTTAKNQDVKYKSQEITDLTKGLAAETADRAGVQTELDAVNEYLASLHKQCDEVTVPYEETKRRREAEIAGLKEALDILEGRAVLLQTGVVEHPAALRGVRRHA